MRQTPFSRTVNGSIVDAISFPYCGDISCGTRMYALCTVYWREGGRGGGLGDPPVSIGAALS